MKDGKNIIIAVLLVAIVIMATGYAAFAQTLNIEGNATIAGEWDVEITDITPVYTGTAAEATEGTKKLSHTATTATFDTVLNAPGDTATYTITIENKGTIDAKLDSATFTPNDATGSEAIKYTVVQEPSAELAAEGTTTAVIKVEYDKSVTTVPTNKTKTITGVISYVQK